MPAILSETPRSRLIGEILSQFFNVPVLAGILLTFLNLHLPSNDPDRLSGYLWAMVFLCLVPLCSLFFYIPGKTREREKILHRQRQASFVLMIISFSIGTLVLHLINAPEIFRAMAELYTLVTIGLIILNLIIHFKASGHAAGVAAPVITMIYLYWWTAVPLLVLLPLVTWAWVSANGHSAWQTVVGACLGFIIAVVVLYGYGFLPFVGQIH